MENIEKETVKVETENKTQPQTRAVVKNFGNFITNVNVMNSIKRRLNDPKVVTKFIADVTSVVNNNPKLQECDYSSIITSGFVAQALNLPLSQSLGFAYVVPFMCKDGSKAQFQMGYKGYVQLALRTGQYKTIGAREVHKSELKGVNQFTGDPIIVFNLDSQEEEIVGYYAYYELLSGARKTIFWPVSKLKAHGQKYSKTYTGGLWKYNFDDMAKKTMLKQLIGKWGIMSTELEMAEKYDQAVIKNNGTPDYVDNPQQQITANTHAEQYKQHLEAKENENNGKSTN